VPEVCCDDSVLVIIRPLTACAAAVQCSVCRSSSAADPCMEPRMATCPECDYDEIDTEDFEEGDTLSCPECGKSLVLVGADELELADDDEDDLDEDDEDDEDEEEFDE